MSAVRDTILNNYLSAYVTPKISRYDSHKKGELRSTYNSIVKLNKESPWYLPVKDKDTQSYAIQLKEGARELRATIAELGGLDDKGLFDKKLASVSDSDIADAIYIGSEEDSGDAPSFDMTVETLASPQINRGRYLPDSAISLPEDTYSFDVNIGEMNYEFQFYISEGETNREVQERLSRLISNSGIGLKATVEDLNGSSVLEIVSDSAGLPTGKERIFTISDDHTSKTSGAVSYFGLNNISERPSDASFTINGEERHASSNHFTVGKMYDITLKQTTSGSESVHIGLKTSSESVTENVSQLIGSYNEFLRSVNEFKESQARSRKLSGELTGITGTYKESLDALGIKIDDNGALTLDKDVLRSVADSSEDLNSTFSSLKDLSQSLLRKSNQVALNPMDYVQRTVVAYKNPGHNFVSPYATSSYTGMMFNFQC